MDMRLIAMANAARERLASVVRDELSELSVHELYDEGTRLINEPHAQLLHRIATRPKDTAALIACHYFNEVVRRAEELAMEM